MSRMGSSVALALVVIGGAWALYHRDQIQSPQDAWQLVQRQLGWNAATADRPSTPALAIGWQVPMEPAPRTDVLRIASFDLQGWGPEKNLDEASWARLVELFARYDVVAVQDLSADGLSQLQKLIRFLNASGRNYAFAASPRSLTSANSGIVLGFVFNQVTVRLDDAFAFPINDPQTSFTVAPYVGWFRAALPRPDRALTFTLVNVQLPPRNQIAELALLPQLFRAVRNDGRGEDDVILLGNLECGLELSDPGLRQAGLSSLLAGRQTTTRGDAGLDHIIIDPQATTEFMGEAGVWDFLKHYNLTLAEALQISDHLPVWAEFSIFEGATPGRVAQDTVNQLLQ